MPPETVMGPEFASIPLLTPETVIYPRRTPVGDLTVREISLPELLCLCRTVRAKNAEHPLAEIGKLYDELIRGGVTISMDLPEFCEFPDEDYLEGRFPLKDFTITACIPVDNKCTQPDVVRYPSCDAVTVNVRERVSCLNDAYEALRNYISAKGYVPAGHPREIYLETGSEETVRPNDPECVTCVIVPVI